MPRKPRTLPFTGSEYLESLDDGRAVWLNGARVGNVATHPGFRNAAHMVARLYDALHDPAHRAELTCETDTGSGGFTHRYFRVARSAAELEAGRDAIACWARLSYGWLGRAPDYKASLLATLGVNEAYYRPFHENAKRWYRQAQERVLFLNHALVDPPTGRALAPRAQQKLNIHVVKETGRGVIVSGAKAVATGAAFTHHCFIAHAGAPRGKRAAITFVVPTSARGLKILCRASYELQAARNGGPFAHPLSSRLDENDAILVFDRVEVPWEDVFIYDPTKAADFIVDSGFQPRAFLHSCTRLAVKLDFVVGAVVRAIELAGSLNNPMVQEKLGELVGWRSLFWALSDAMVAKPVPWLDGSVQPQPHYGAVFRMMLQDIYPRLRTHVAHIFSSGLIYANSHAVPGSSPALKGALERYLRGTQGDSTRREKVMRLVWDSVGSEFASRQELYELMHLASPQVSRTNLLYEALRHRDLDRGLEMVDTFLAEYDVKGWVAPDLAAAGEKKRGRARKGKKR